MTPDNFPGQYGVVQPGITFSYITGSIALNIV